ncbi:MAG: glycerol-3-phosphate 1-O-acyltransferase PlsY [Coriobacteriia bacterium]|nr:glycerol-3-phosphate 1-O-acyltransferase PlsY [Coriobacteriia bacterium]
MELAIRIVAVLVASYLIGGIPWALIIGKSVYHIDLRTCGSGNLGATNVFRELGARAALFTLFLDAFKGVVAVLVAGFIVPSSVWTPTTSEWVAVGAMAAAVVGHSYSPYIRLSGGKGVATSAGALFVLTPAAAFIELLVFALVVSTSRIVSLGSIAVALTYPLLTLRLYPDNRPTQITVTALAALVLWRHRANIVRIARGEERKISVRGRGRSHSDTEE